MLKGRAAGIATVPAGVPNLRGCLQPGGQCIWACVGVVGEAGEVWFLRGALDPFE